jgi:hypothetical protein
MAIYICGKEVERLPVRGNMKAAERVDLLIGRTREAVLPVQVKQPVK